jgi:hypothetical protein
MSAVTPGNRQLRQVATSPEARTNISSDDLVRVLLAHGGQVIADDEHGAFVRICKRLIFIRRAVVVDGKGLRDALRAADVGAGRFDILLERIRGEPSP